MINSDLNFEHLAINDVPNEIRIRPFLRRDDAVLQGLKINPERDLFKSVLIRRQKVPGTDGYNSVKSKVVTQEPWSGDPDEEFHWHDRRRKHRTEAVYFSIYTVN